MKSQELPKQKLEKLNILANQIIDGQIPASDVSYGGAGVIITSKENSPYPLDHWKRYPDDLVIRTDNHKEFSWLVFQLQEIDGTPAFAGKLIGESLTLRSNIKAQMLYVINVVTYKIYNNLSDSWNFN